MGHLLCTTCQKTYGLDEPVWRCECGGLLDIVFTPVIDPGEFSRGPLNLWRYAAALPLPGDVQRVSFDEGFTPLTRFVLDGAAAWVKQDHLFASGSYKDRGAAVLISKARQLGVQQVVEDSSGNAGCAIAAYCARADIACDIYVPADTSPGKLAQMRMAGANMHLIPGSREDTARAVMSAAQHTYYASHSWNPFFFHGTKTWAYEVVEQLGWQSPDYVVLPAGNGTLLLGAALGFAELHAAGVITHVPRIIAVQSARCAPLETAFRQGGDAPAAIQKGDTLAEGIAIAEPVRGAQILAAVRQSSGEFLTVSEEQIIAALRETASMGFYMEPTAAATIAGLRLATARYPGARMVSVFTGHGLKSTEKMLHLLEEG